MKKGCHNFNFKIGNDFFALFEESEIKEAALNVVVKADKASSHIDLNVVIDGIVNVSCDRCLGVFSFPLKCDYRLLVKFGKVHDETDPDIITLPAEESELDLMHYFFEYIILALPIQRIHPVDENGNSTCDPEMINKLNRHMINIISTVSCWDELKKIMNN